MKINWLNFLVFALLFVVVTGCSAINQIKKEIDKTQQPKVIKSSDGKAQITVPGSWSQETKLNEAATLQASNNFQQLYIVVIPLNKVDLTEDVTLDKMNELSRQDMSENLSDVKIGETVSTVINGLPARQFEIAGTVEGFKAKYIYTIVDSPQNFYQIATWTLASRFDGSKNQLLEVINSFQENETAAADEPPPPPAPIKSPKK